MTKEIIVVAILILLTRNLINNYVIVMDYVQILKKIPAS